MRFSKFLKEINDSKTKKVNFYKKNNKSFEIHDNVMCFNLIPREKNE